MSAELAVEKAYKLYQLPNDIDFKVIKKPIYFLNSNEESRQEIEIPNRYALINEATKQPLSVVSNKYKLRTYRALVWKVSNAIREANMTDNITIKDWVNPNGTKFKRDVYFWNNGIPVKDNYKEKAVPHLRIYASYDSSWAEQIIFGSVYVLCMNGLVRPEWQFKVYNKHSAANDTDYTVEMFKQGLNAQKDLGNELFKYIQRKVSNNEVEYLFKNTIAKLETTLNAGRFSDNVMYDLSNLWDKYRNSYGNTVFAVYQAVTDWSSHPVTRGSKELVKRRREQKVINMLNSNYWLTLTN